METEKRQYIYKIIMLVILTITITFIVTSIVVYNYVSEQQIGQTQTYTIQQESELGRTLQSFRNIIDKYYLGEVNENDLMQGAIKGYISGLNDEYTEYYTPEEMTEMLEQTIGKFEGIGIYMANDTLNNRILILQPIKGTPAYEAGLLPGDYILKVDDITYTGEQLAEASSKIKGASGTTVKLEILREEEILEFEIVREEVKIYHIETEILSNNIGYMELTTFDGETYKEFKEKYDELKSQGITSLIIDLRNNGGGIVDESKKIADLFVEKDKDLLITLDKNNNKQIDKATSDIYINIPTVVLVNENTASASEILTGILKDYKKATIIGTKTYGKGVIQQLLTLTDGSGLKITSNEYTTPNGNKIEDIGIEPDIQVELPEDIENILDVEKDKDTQLKKAIEVLTNR